jgi:hypothetical protein
MILCVSLKRLANSVILTIDASTSVSDARAVNPAQVALHLIKQKRPPIPFSLDEKTGMLRLPTT